MDWTGNQALANNKWGNYQMINFILSILTALSFVSVMNVSVAILTEPPEESLMEMILGKGGALALSVAALYICVRLILALLKSKDATTKDYIDYLKKENEDLRRKGGG